MQSTGTRQYWLGFDLGATKMLAMVFDERLRPAGMRRRRTQTLGPTRGFARLVETIDQALADAGVERSSLAGIGMAAPGMLDLDRGILLQAPNLGWRQVPLKRKLEREFGVPAVLANDVDAGTYAEYRYGAARGARCVVGVFPGTGIGGACVYEGRLLRGKIGSCMEIGHVPVMADGPLCGCGRRGCLEALASRLAISAELAQAAYRGMAPHLLEIAGTDLTAIRSAAIRKAIARGDRVVEDIVRHAARQIGQVLVGVIHLLAPDVIVLGGGLVGELGSLFLEEIRATTRVGVTDAFRGTFRVVAAKFGDRATTLGAAALAADAARG